MKGKDKWGNDILVCAWCEKPIMGWNDSNISLEMHDICFKELMDAIKALAKRKDE